MDTLGFLAGTSIVLGAFLGAMSQFVFHLPAMVSGGIAISSIIGLFLITLVLNSISFRRSSHNYMEE
jgi:hypothetical protein